MFGYLLAVGDNTNSGNTIPLTVLSPSTLIAIKAYKNDFRPLLREVLAININLLFFLFLSKFGFMKPNFLFDAQNALAIMQSTILADEFHTSHNSSGKDITVQGVGRGDVLQQKDKMIVSTSSARVEIKELG